jgi:hypothetical protein
MQYHYEYTYWSRPNATSRSVIGIRHTEGAQIIVVGVLELAERFFFGKLGRPYHPYKK